MGTFNLTCEFDITRRIGWSDEQLGEHIDAVFERLHQADGIKQVVADADLDTGRTSVSITFATFGEDPKHSATVLLGVAIRLSGAAHLGLLSLGEEAVVRPEGNRWSGLKQPTWRIRQIDFGDAPPYRDDGTLRI